MVFYIDPKKSILLFKIVGKAYSICGVSFMLIASILSIKFLLTVWAIDFAQCRAVKTENKI